MKDSTDKGTGDMFGEKRGRGRPKTGTAKTKAVHNGTSVDNAPAHRPNPRPDGRPPVRALAHLAKVLFLE